MQKKYITILLIVSFCSLLYAQKPDDTQKKTTDKIAFKNRINSDDYKVSNARIEMITAVVQKYYDKHENLESSSVKTSIQQEIGKQVILVPNGVPDSRSDIAIRNSLQGKVDKKYNQDLADYQKKISQEFRNKYPLFKKNQKVTIYYTRGGSARRISGIFYGVKGNVIQINSKTVALIDVTPESRIHIDSAYNTKSCNEYVEQKLNGYRQEKNKYMQKLYTAEKKQQREKNEKLGYILRNGSWVSAQSVLDEVMKTGIAKQKVRAAKEAKEKAGQNNNTQNDIENQKKDKKAEKEAEDEDENENE